MLFEILEELSPRVCDTLLLREVNNIYIKILNRNEEMPKNLKKVFIINLVMTTFLTDKSFVKRILDQKLDVQDVYLPFLVDSDAIL